MADRWQVEQRWGGERKWQTWGGHQPPKPAKPPEPNKASELTDELGLSIAVYGRFPLAVRYFVNIALDYQHLSKTKAPASVGFGTVPEQCFYGLLLDADFRPTKQGFLDKTHRSFIFQSRVLGGRQPGGAVADFIVFHNGRTIAVRVQSVFHDEHNPFGSGGAKAEADRNQFYKLKSSGFIDAVVDVNIGVHPLENGPASLVGRIFDVYLLLDRRTLPPVQCHVFANAHDLKVLDMIIEPVMVLVMHMLTAQEWATKVLLHYVAMLVDTPASWHGDRGSPASPASDHHAMRSQAVQSDAFVGMDSSSNFRSPSSVATMLDRTATRNAGTSALRLFDQRYADRCSSRISAPIGGA